MSKDNDSPGDRERVAAKIAVIIIEFYNMRRASPVFLCDDLRRFVYDRACVAPASPDRILRMLRQEGLIDYVVTDRKNSEYTFFYPDTMAW